MESSEAGTLPCLPKGYTRSYAYVYNPQGEVVMSKWWATASCRDAFRRENQWRLQALAKARAVRLAMRAAGQEQATPKEIKRVCLRCRRIEMRGKQQYCDKCYAKRRNETRRGSEVAEMANSPIGAQALMKAEFEGGYHPSQMHKTGLGIGPELEAVAV